MIPECLISSAGTGRAILDHFLADSDVEGYLSGFSNKCWLGNDFRMKLPHMLGRSRFGLGLVSGPDLCLRLTLS